VSTSTSHRDILEIRVKAHQNISEKRMVIKIRTHYYLDLLAKVNYIFYQGNINMNSHVWSPSSKKLRFEVRSHVPFLFLYATLLRMHPKLQGFDDQHDGFSSAFLSQYAVSPLKDTTPVFAMLVSCHNSQGLYTFK
jgi:hypothetical protein